MITPKLLNTPVDSGVLISGHAPTLVAGQEDPWPALEKQFPPGKVFTGVVRHVIDSVGSFVTVDGGVNGLIPERTLTGPCPPVGSRVEARVTKMDRPNRKVNLRLIRVLDNLAALSANPLMGQQGYGRVVKAVPYKDGRGGFILLEISGRERPALLLAKDMSEELREDLNNERVDVDEEIYVEVIRIEEDDDKVFLRELPDPEDQPGSDEPTYQAAA